MRTCLACLLALAAAAPPRAAAAQRHRSGSLEVAASLVQGNTEQRSAFTRAELAHADSSFEVRGSFSFAYADAGRDSLPRQVTRRSWLGAVALDYRPQDRVSPFVFLNYETSYEKRVLDRIGLGFGGKVVVYRTASSTANVSLAILEERLRPSRLAPDTAPQSAARWSGRVRVRHQFDSKLRLSHTTYYQPRIANFNSYTVNSSTELAYAIRQSMSLTISYFSLLDSDARARGARSNNDAQLLLGLRATL